MRAKLWDWRASWPLSDEHRRTNRTLADRFKPAALAFFARLKSTKREPALPIGRTARIAFEIDAVRAGCSKAAQHLMRQTPLNEAELEECARLDDALAKVHRLLRATVRGIMVSRLNRKSRAR